MTAHPSDKEAIQLFDDTARRKITLTIGISGDELLLSLSEDGSLLLVGETAHIGKLTAYFDAQWQAANPEMQCASTWRQSYGSELFEKLIPQRLKRFFIDSDGFDLHLMLSPQVSDLPWGIMFDGRQHWSDHHRVTKLVVGARTTSMRSIRHITALSYDLVDSTNLMLRIGMELYSLALQDYHARFSNIIKRWQGASHPHQGNDGTMCYFGASTSNENTTRSAISAALDLADVAKLLGVELRIGMASGSVAVDAAQLVGPAVHLAARLRSIAKPGDVVVSETTANLTNSYFDFELVCDFPPLKDYPNVVSAFIVTRAKPINQQKNWAKLYASPLIGRDIEFALLEKQWAYAQQGAGAWIHIVGEAGIGKSRLIATFSDSIIEKNSAQIYTCRCFPENVNRAFGPIIDLIEYWGGILTTDNMLTRQQKLHALVTTQPDYAKEHLVVSYLLDLPLRSAEMTHLGREDPRRQLIMQTMTQWMLRQAKSRPALLVFEDIQWADPSTVDFLEHLKAACVSSSLMIVTTERAEKGKSKHLGLVGNCLHLDRISSAAVREMIRVLTISQALPRTLVDTIDSKSDGIPLYVEMSTKMVLENQNKVLKDGQSGLVANFTIPSTVHDLLIHRLDNLGPVRSLAQLCSVVGREFSKSLLSKLVVHHASPVPAHRLEKDLTALLYSGLILETPKTEGQFYFRHALIQDAAYQSMWENDRRMLHAGIAQTIEVHFSDALSSQPEILAHHYACSGSSALAVKWHMLAVKKHKRNESHAEAISHLGIAKTLLLTLACTKERNQSQLAIELATAGQLIATKGYGSSQVGECYMQSLMLSQDLDDKKSLLRAQLGLVIYHFQTGNFSRVRELIEQTTITAFHFNDGLTNAQCQWTLAVFLFHSGHVADSLTEMQKCIDKCRKDGLSTQMVQSPEVMSLMYSSFCYWELGLPDTALLRAQSAVERAREMSHRLSVGQALGMQAMVQYFCGQFELAKTTSKDAFSVCEAGELAMWTAHARFMIGCATAHLGEPRGGLDTMDAADALWASTGSILTRSFYLSTRAYWYSKLGQHSMAKELIEQAWHIVDHHGERYCEPEVLRIKAEILQMAMSADTETDLQEVESLLLEAIASAQVRKLTSLELRATTSLARLHAQSSKQRSSLDLLNHAINQMHEGHGCQDYLEAIALRNNLQNSSSADTAISPIALPSHMATI